jgi:hypothetical protein
MKISPTSARSTRTASLIAGFALLAMAVVAGLANFVAIQPLITPGDAARTAADIADSDGLFRLGVAGFVVVAVLDVIVAVALREVFAPVNRAVSTAAAWFRLAYTAVLMVAISHLAAALPSSTATLDAHQVLTELHLFDVTWQVGLVLFGIHLVLLGYLAFRFGFVAKVIAVLLVVAGLGYLIDSFASILVPGYSISVGSVAFIGEVVFIFWLLIRGGRASVPNGTMSS